MTSSPSGVLLSTIPPAARMTGSPAGAVEVAMFEVLNRDCNLCGALFNPLYYKNFYGAPFPPKQNTLQMFKRPSEEFLPSVVHGVSDDLLAVGRDRDGKLDRLGIQFGVVARFLRQLPVGPAIELLHHADLHRFLLVVADLDLEGLVSKPAERVDLI